MAVRTIPSQKQHLKEQISDIALQNPQISVKASLELMKKMTVVAVSTITYLRGIFPGESFTEKMLEGQKVYLLTGKEDLDDSNTVINWLKCAFELVDSQHLKNMTLLIRHGQFTLEMYTLSFTYNEDAIRCDLIGKIDGKDVILSQSVPEDITKNIRQLIRSILVRTSTLQPLPNDCEVTMKILLDETTPRENVPPVFRQSSSEDGIQFPGNPETLKLGKVETKFTTFAVSTKSVLDQEFCGDSAETEEKLVLQAEVEVEDEVPGSQVEPSPMNVSELGNSPFHKTNYLDYEVPEQVPILPVVSKTVSKALDSETTSLSDAFSIVNVKEETVSCICECVDLFDDTIKCSSCSTFQHKTCYKLLKCHKVDAHICVSCHDPDKEKICSVPELIKDVNRKAEALFRQGLMYCCSNPQVSCRKIMTHLRVPRRMAEKIFQQLDQDGCFQPGTNKGLTRNVKLDLKENISQHFKAPLSSGRILLDAQYSPVFPHSSLPVSKKLYGSTKRQLEEEKENLPGSASCSQQKRPKIHKTATKLTNSSYN